MYFEENQEKEILKFICHRVSHVTKQTDWWFENRINAIKKEYALRGDIDATLECIYQNPQNQDMIEYITFTKLYPSEESYTIFNYHNCLHGTSFMGCSYACMLERELKDPEMAKLTEPKLCILITFETPLIAKRQIYECVVENGIRKMVFNKEMTKNMKLPKELNLMSNLMSTSRLLKSI